MLEEADQTVREIKTTVDSLASKLKGMSISRDLENAFSSFNQQLTAYSKAISDENSNPQSIMDICKMIGIYGIITSQQISADKRFEPIIKDLSIELQKKSNMFQTWTQNRPELRKVFEGKMVQLPRLGDFIIPRTPSEVKEAQKEALSEVEKKLLKVRQELEAIHKKSNQEQKELLEKYENKFSESNKILNKLEINTTEKIKSIDEIYHEKIESIEEKEKEINNLLGVVSGNTIAGNFEKSAEDEKNMADILRRIVLGGMLLITIIIGYSFYESIASFSWETSMFRIVLVIFLSVPTTYLARESSKHRKQQYKHLQMSLELKATTPYWNSLPKEEQDKLKIELSKKIFAQNNNIQNESDSYPLNMQELMLKVIDKIPSNK